MMLLDPTFCIVFGSFIVFFSILRPLIDFRLWLISFDNSLRAHLNLLQTSLRVINVSVVSLPGLLEVQFLAGFFSLSQQELICHLRWGEILVCFDGTNVKITVRSLSGIRYRCIFLIRAEGACGLIILECADRFIQVGSRVSWSLLRGSIVLCPLSCD